MKEKTTPCEGFEVEPGVMSGCRGGVDCPVCHGNTIDSMGDDADMLKAPVATPAAIELMDALAESNQVKA